MEDAEARDCNREAPQKCKCYSCGKFLIDIGTLTVLTVTMVFVIIYACAANTQNAQQMFLIRPVLMSNGMVPDRMVNGFPTVMHSNVVNFGKTVALTVALPGELIIKDAEYPGPYDPRCPDDGELPRDVKLRIKDVPVTALSQVDAVAGHPNPYGQDWKLKDRDSLTDMSGKALYAVGCVYYKGLDGSPHWGDICAKWADGGFQTCDSKERNYVK